MKQYKMIQPKEYVEISNIKPGMYFSGAALFAPCSIIVSCNSLGVTWYCAYFALQT